jgi:glycosyltransferase involved in cell wall biosynthesis
MKRLSQLLMAQNNHKPIRVLYSFPHKLGAGRICTTAWHQVEGIAAAGADVTVFTGCISRPLPREVKVHTTLAWGNLRVPYRLLGTLHACALHDWLVACKLPAMAGKVDVVHVWPLGALRTLQAAKRLGIATVLERPNAHTLFAYKSVQDECRRLGVTMPKGHEHEFNPAVLARENQEYELADKLLCPSDFVVRTFREHGFPDLKLATHQYGYDEKIYHPAAETRSAKSGLIFLFAGGCAPRKGLHYALDAWLQSSASRDGAFLIAGGFIPGYAEALRKQLAHPRVKVLGHRNDMPELMRQSDVLVLPSIEEGSALVTYEARGSGCVLLVSDAAGAICNHGVDALIHPARDANALMQHMNLLHEDRTMLERLRTASTRSVHEITWNAAGLKLLRVYKAL